ncbi:helix-turn-helix domain-containing protein [Micromonospora sp. DT47]|uniref:helix-turn-helix domain-containing protein n=1 Tax=Micromonospora sp. DT47 TaxID=3393431 RepID=UPI003CE6F4D9
MQLRYRYRVYPTREQQVSLAQAFGCARVVWCVLILARWNVSRRASDLLPQNGARRSHSSRN